MPSIRPTRCTDVTLQSVGQEAILYDRQHGRAHVINGAAARIWELCDGRATLDEIAVAFAAAYGVLPSAVQDDVARIVATFHTLEVLHP